MAEIRAVLKPPRGRLLRWVTQPPPVAITRLAAALVVAFILIGISMPALSKARRSSRSYEVAFSPELELAFTRSHAPSIQLPAKEGWESGFPASTPSPVGQVSPDEPSTPSQIPGASILQAPSDIAELQFQQEAQQAVGDETSANDKNGLTDGRLGQLPSARAPGSAFSPQPAAFDSVAMIRSPIKMPGIYSRRTPGERGKAISQYGGGGGDKDTISVSGLIANKPSDSPARREDSTPGQLGYSWYDEVQEETETSLEGRRILHAEQSQSRVGNREALMKVNTGRLFPVTPPPPPQDSSSPASAAFDSGAIVKSPLIVNEINGKRNAEGDDDDLKELAAALSQPAAPEKDERRIEREDEVGYEFSAVLAQGRATANALERKREVGKGRGDESGERPQSGKAGEAIDDVSVRPQQPAEPQPASETGAGSGGGEGKKETEKLNHEIGSLKKAKDALKALTEEAPTASEFKTAAVNPFLQTAAQPVSTFGIDVDTAAYTLARRYMTAGALPPPEAVRTEEFINFFDYDYNPPAQDTFAIHAELAPSPFGRGLHLLKVGIKGRRVGREEQRHASLTLVIDSSGSMNTPDRLGLVRKSLRMLVERLAPEDLVAIVQYDNKARLVLDHTPAAQKEKILAVIRNLQTSGSTNLEEGMRLGYDVAARGFVSRGENRVLLLSDGMANLGSVEAADILNKVAAFRAQGVRCSVFGFGLGSYNDTMLESLADKGDGTYTFIDSEEEARRVFVDDLAATLNTIAGDTRIQVEFNPRLVAKYRQLGYENRQMTKEQFRDDQSAEVKALAGEVGSGKSVTALYEMEMGGLQEEAQAQSADAPASLRPEPIATVRVRYRNLATGQMEEIEKPITADMLRATFQAASTRFRLGACVAEFAEILRGSPHAAGSEVEAVAGELRPVALELSLDQQVQALLQLVQAAQGMPRATE